MKTPSMTLRFNKLVLAMALSGSLGIFGANATGSDGAGSFSNESAAKTWQPAASDTLVKLPANIIEKRIEQDFNASPMSARLTDVDGQMQQKTQRIAALKQDMRNASSEQLQDIKYELVQEKSAYLDLLHESHELRNKMATQKQLVYQDLLEKLRNQYGEVTASEQFKIKEKQTVARKRMEKVISQVDETLMHGRFGENSQYSGEYAANLAQIEKLKNAISRHDANQQATWNGETVSSEEYVRQLLMNSSQEHALLNQEGLILSYMSRLVALDAQALEYEIAYGDTGNQPNYGHQTRNAVDVIL